MSLNTAHANNGVLLYAGETILIYEDKVVITIEACNLPTFRGKKKGGIYLTTHRVIFLNDKPLDELQSFSIPFVKFEDIKVNQPLLGANYITGTINAEHGGNWEGSATFKMWFKNGGVIEFAQAMKEAAYFIRQFPHAVLTLYQAPVGPFLLAPATAYACYPQPQYQWLPNDRFTQAPPPYTVYTTSMPPPYPGLDSNPVPPNHAQVASQDERVQGTHGNPQKHQ